MADQSLSCPLTASEAVTAQRGFVLSRGASFWVAGFVLVLILWASAAPSALYPSYAAEWGLSPGTVTTVFAAYPLALIAFLVFLGGISDVLGRRTTMLAGVILLVGSSVLLATADGLAWLYVGRVLQGVSTGLALSAASAAMIEFEPNGNTARASSLSTAAISTGIVMGQVVTGALVQYAPLPLHLAFWALGALCVLATGLIIAMPVPAMRLDAPRRSVAASLRALQPRFPRVPRPIVRAYATSALAISTSFATGAMLLSLGAVIARNLLATSNMFVIALVLATASVTSAGSAIGLRKMRPSVTIVSGGIVAVLGFGLLILAAWQGSLALLVAATLVGGIGNGLPFLGGLGLISRTVPAQHRAETLSAVYLAAYFSQALVAITAGLLANRFGLQEALLVVAPIIVGICGVTVALGLLDIAVARRESPAEARV